ncbi:conjugal transfer protein TraF [Sphingobium aromaticivastans]|uniref:conjugal transfer protein TraF n=1 Tax=Sphingobium aromaticivastans TaxID=1778665 RepID=UPI003AFA8BCA
MRKGRTALIAMLALAALAGHRLAIPVHAQETATDVDGGEPEPQGDDFYCGQRRLGQWFYCTRPRPAPRKGAAAPQSSAAERMTQISQQLNELKARAILEPSEQNVIAYVRFQREQLDRASTFSDTWQRALWQNPDLDYTLQRPVSTVGKRAWLDNRKADRDAVLESLSQRYGLFYFYAQSCGACEIFGPILRSVADSHGMAVMAVSMDGGPNRDFPNYVVDAGQRARMGVPGNETPALVLFDTTTKRTIPVGFGMLSADEIMDRIFMLTNTRVGSDY